MEIIDTAIKGLAIIKPRVFKDDRGYFYEAYNEKLYEEYGISQHFVQDNQSFSYQGVIRALHYQIGDHAQAKLVRVLSGIVLDVAVDLRKDSVTFGEHIAVELTHENKKQLFIPRGFAHGFVVLSDSAEFFYKCDNYYNKASEGGIIFNDPTLNIDWKLPADQYKVSEKDLVLPPLEKARL